MTSFLSRSLVMTLAFLCSGMAAAEVVVPLTIGGTDIRFATDDGYVRTSEILPTVHAVVAAGLPPGNRLVEGFVSEADAKRMVLGLPWQDTFVQVQALRNAEALDFSEADWEQGRPAIAEALGVLDFNALLASQTEGSAARMSAASGIPLSATFGEVGKPALYAVEGISLRFLMLLPMTVDVAGKSHQISLESAGAVVLLSGKLAYVFAYRNHVEGNDTSAVRDALDRFVDRAIALNPVVPVYDIAPTAGQAATAQ